MQSWPEECGNPEGRADRTDDCSFVLRPDSHGGVGVFAAHAIRAGTLLRLYDEPPGTSITRKVRREAVPGEFVKYCLDAEPGWLIRPVDFGRMDVVWFLNHASVPNAGHRGDHVYFALRDIAAGEEILIDYETL
jgi:SET domain-containing protein